MEKVGVKTPEKTIDKEMTKEQLNYHFYKEYCRLFIAQGIIKKEIGGLSFRNSFLEPIRK